MGGQSPFFQSKDQTAQLNAGPLWECIDRRAMHPHLATASSQQPGPLPEGAGVVRYLRFISELSPPAATR